jgi:hypothetical protein
MHGEMRNEYNILVGQLKGRERLGRGHGIIVRNTETRNLFRISRCFDRDSGHRQGSIVWSSDESQTE